MYSIVNLDLLTAVSWNSPDSVRTVTTYIFREIEVLTVDRLESAGPTVFRELDSLTAFRWHFIELKSAGPVGGKVYPASVSRPSRGVFIGSLSGKPAREAFRLVHDVDIVAAFFIGSESDLLSIGGPVPIRGDVLEKRELPRIRSVTIANPDFLVSGASGGE
jgi:hypothetical protein